MPKQRHVPVNTTHTNRKTLIHLTRFEPAVPRSDQLQSHALERAATGIGTRIFGLPKPYPYYTNTDLHIYMKLYSKYIF